MMPELMKLTGTLELQAATKTKPARLRIVAYTGGTIRVPGFSRPVVVDLAGLSAPPSVPILDGHANALDAIIGAGDVTNDGRTLTVAGRLADTDVAAKVRALLESGVPLQASIGASVMQSRDVRPGESLSVNKRQVKADAPLTLVERAELREVSIVALGADGESEVSIAAAAARKDSTMETEIEAARAEERARLAEIDALCRNLDGPRVAELRARAIAGDLTLDALRAGLLEHVRASRPRPPAPAGDTAEAAAPDVLTAAALLLLGKSSIAEKAMGARACNAAADLRCRSALDLCAAALRLDGRDVPRAMDGMIRAAFSTVSLPNALGLAGEKIALAAYMAAPATWRAFCNVVPVRSFRAHTLIRLNDLGAMPVVGDAGELAHGTLTESPYQIRAQTVGKMFVLTRQAVINDDLQLFDTIPAALGRQAANAVADEVYRILVANGGSFFGDGNGNVLEGGGTALGLDALAAAIALMRRQTDADGRPIGLVPTTLVVAPELEQTARAVLNSTIVARDTTDADNLPAGNPLLNAVALQVEPRLTAAAVWYLFAAPSDGAVSVGFLNGVEAPTVEQVDLPPEQLGIGWRAFLDFGAALGDPKAAVRADPNG